MTTLKVGALFAGYGGIEIALAQVASEHPGVEVVLAWYCEIEPAASAILAHRYPGVPNHGDVTKVDWAAVEPVDVITGGSPCQDLSHAGKRKGMRAGTRSGLWASMCDAIDIIRPALVVWENVRGALSAEADSELEPCPGCVGGGDDGPVLRALGRVLGDLAELGFDARWYGLRAADVGAPHGRFRIFLFATPADAASAGRAPLLGERAEPARSGAADATGTRRGPAALTLLPTPTVSDTNGAGAHGDGGADLRTAVSLLPTPRATDGTKGGPNRRGSSGDLMLPSAVQALLPTPRATRGGSATETTHRLFGTPTATMSRRSEEFASVGESPSEFAARYDGSWGDYGPAIARWQTVLGRSSPAPTEPGRNGGHRLSPRFVEWMMGLPDGWVCDVPGITRNQALKALGNGVVPQQCAAAFRAFLADTAEVAA